MRGAVTPLRSGGRIVLRQGQGAGVVGCVLGRVTMPWLMPRASWRTSDVGYVRLHGRDKQAWRSGPDRYDYDYSKDELAEWVTNAREMSKGAKKTYIFFNNCHGGKAAANARLMQELIEAAGL